MQNTINLEMIFTKDKMLEEYIATGGGTSEYISISSFVLRKWNKDWGQNCNMATKIFKGIDKDKKRPIRDFKCEFFRIPNTEHPYENSSILISLKDPNAVNKFFYEHWFRLPVSENVTNINLNCEKNCREMLQVLDHIVNSITLN